MPLNTTKREQQLQLAQDLAAKLKIERGFKIDLRRFFKDMNREFKSTYISTSRIINVRNFDAELVGILRKHYRKAIKRFGSTLQKNIKALSDEITAEQLEFMRRDTDAHAEIILGTVASQYDKIVASAFEGAEVAEQLSSEAIGTTAAAAFSSLIPSKSDLIAEIETQNAAEGSKDIELESLVLAGVLSAALTEKQWLVRFTEGTRDWHAAVDGQRRKVGELYDVNNQKLSRPGDMTHGATMDNIARCNCSSITIIN